MAEKILVTGINGFVGGHVAHAFQQDGYDVIGLAHNNTPAGHLSHSLHSFIQCDLLDQQSVRSIDLSGVRAIIHLAGLSSVGASFEHPQRYIADNPIMTYNLLDAARQRHFRGRTIVVSTGALYDPHQTLPIGETSPTKPTSPYAIGKLATEHTVSFFQAQSLDVVVARPFNHIGPGQGAGFLLPDLYQQLAESTDGIIRVGNLTTKRDYTDVRDIVLAYKQLALASKLNHSLYNICSGRSLSGEQILTLLKRHGDFPAIKVKVDETKLRPNDIMDIYGDASRIKEDLGWHPTYSIEQTVADFIADKRK